MLLLHKNTNKHQRPNTDDANESQIFDHVRFGGIVNVVIPY